MGKTKTVMRDLQSSHQPNGGGAPPILNDHEAKFYYHPTDCEGSRNLLSHHLPERWQLYDLSQRTQTELWDPYLRRAIPFPVYVNGSPILFLPNQNNITIKGDWDIVAAFPHYFNPSTERGAGAQSGPQQQPYQTGAGVGASIGNIYRPPSSTHPGGMVEAPPRFQSGRVDEGTRQLANDAYEQQTAALMAEQRAMVQRGGYSQPPATQNVRPIGNTSRFH